MHTPTMQAGWLAPDDAVNLSASGQNASRPQIAVDGNGVATAIWRQNFGPNTAIQASTQTIPGLWSAPSNLSEVTFTNDPQIAVNANGIAAAVWRQTGLVGTVVQASTQTTSGVWPLPAETVAFNVGTPFANPQTAIDGNGIATVVWGHTTPGIIIQAFTETDIGVWPNPFTPVTLSDAVGDEANPQIAVNSDGIATAIWRRTNGGNEIIQARTETAPNVWSPTATLLLGAYIS